MIDLRCGDCLEVLRGMDADSVDSVVTDPPYGLSFMGKKWDTFDGICTECGNDHATDGFSCCSDCLPHIGDQARLEQDHGGRSMLGHVSANWHDKGTHSRGYADNNNPAFQRWCERWARETLRVAKPGAYMLAFGGTRTYHRLACAIEDAGWEMRDCIMWVYGSGFPKGLNLDGDRTGWGTALKPALEPITVARKPLVGTVAQNVMQHGTVALNIDGCRIPSVDKIKAVNGKATLCGTRDGYDRPWKHDPDALAARQERANAAIEKANTIGRWPANLIHDGSEEAADPLGSAARFFYCAKASKADRDEGLSAESQRPAGVGDERPSGSSEERRGKKAVQPRANIHPTVKPTDLMRYLCRLVTPPCGVVLDPFMGSGSTGKAAILEGFRFVGIEREADYIEIARARIEAARREAGLFGEA